MDDLDLTFPITAQVRPTPLSDGDRLALERAVHDAADDLYCAARPITVGKLLDSRPVQAVADRVQGRAVTYDDVGDIWRTMRREFAVRDGGAS